ncbi:DNA topoisomerase III [Erwinia typographi]|uniref:DNA topoisomerase n=1 Tax=Erwinia typographi TaxID=371042 RepID=A0A0A3YNG9_9GAMM|nr:type IA DNA topoisomerase [Erwinia typographi]KGT87024.1 DNA topoisomerase III [Erwinia typographi]
MRLFIAEKKGLGEVIAQALGNGVNRGGYIECGEDVVTWGSGHLLELVSPEQHNPAYAKWNEADLPMKLRPHRYQPIERTASQFRTVVGLIERASEIVHAGDPDAEGQLLIDEILTYTDCNKPVKRVLINDLNTEKARQALTRLRDNSEFYGLSQSALARSIADQLYGLNMTRGYTLAARKKGMQGMLSVGRVQTVILGLIVHRYEAFKNHAAAFYYAVSAGFTMNGIDLTRCDGGEIPARLIVPEDAPTDDKNRITDKSYADNIVSMAQSQPVTVTLAQTDDKTTPAPLPFSLLDLQVQMSREHGISADKTLAVTQSLRDNFKAITYNRSDCRYLSTEQFDDAPQTLAAVSSALKGHFPADVLASLDSSRKNRAFNDEKVSAHTAIIPTGTEPDTARMSREELTVYTAIATQYLCQFLPEKAWKQATVRFSVAGYDFVSNARKTILPGWTELLKEQDEAENSDEISAGDDAGNNLFSILTALSVNDGGTCKTVTIKTEKTKPLPLYTEATLLRDLQRVAKYVKNPRIKALLVNRDKNTEGENGGIGTPATRAGMLEILQKRDYFTIEKKKLVPTELGISFINSLPAIATEPDMTALWHEQQQQIEKGEMTCEAFLDELEIFIEEQLKNVDVSSLSVKTSPPKKNTENSQRERLDAPCPSCGKRIIATPKTYSCTGCNFKIWSTLAGKTLTKNQVETIITKGKSSEIKGFISTKTGKSFSAFVRLDDKATGKVAFEFPPRKS